MKKIIVIIFVLCIQNNSFSQHFHGEYDSKNQKIGVWPEYDSDSLIIRKYWYNKGVLESFCYVDKNGKDRYDVILINDSIWFNGGKDSLNKFIGQNINKNSINDVNGYNIISFIVEKDGNISNIRVVKSMSKLCDKCDNESKNIISKMNNLWINYKKQPSEIRLSILFGSDIYEKF